MRWRRLRARADGPTSTSGGSGEHGRFYVGRRPEGTEVYVVTRRDVVHLRPRPHRGDASFEWGASRVTGRVELAHAVLRDAPVDGVIALMARGFPLWL
jgi:hypothetical protein